MSEGHIVGLIFLGILTHVFMFVSGFIIGLIRKEHQ